jgi:HAD superfamily hydrolase (TIGR01509 family)
MILLRRLSAVILDMDGTLHDTEAVYHAALKQAVATVGFAVTDEFCHSLIGIPALECDVMLREHLGPHFPSADCDRHYRQYRDQALNAGIPLKVGAVELVNALAHGRLKRAVATSASRHAADLHLGRSGLRDKFQVIVTRDDVAHGKPFPDVFLRAAELLDVLPAECLAVEDSMNGVRAAHAAGMMPVMVPDMLQPTREIAALCVRVVADLHEVRAIIGLNAAGTPE